MKSRILLNIVISKGTTIFKLLPRKDWKRVVWGKRVRRGGERGGQVRWRLHAWIIAQSSPLVCARQWRCHTPVVSYQLARAHNRTFLGLNCIRKRERKLPSLSLLLHPVRFFLPAPPFPPLLLSLSFFLFFRRVAKGRFPLLCLLGEKNSFECH